MMPVISYYYTIPYLFSCLFLVLMMYYEFHLINRQKNIQKIKILIAFWFLFFFGLRGYVLEDWTNYYHFFYSLPSINTFKIEDNYYGFEIGFVFYTLVIKTLFNDYHIWIFISSAIDFFVLNWFVKKYSPYYVMPFILFFAFTGISLEIDTMRNVKSIMFFLLSVPYLQRGYFIKYSLLNLIGMLWHSISVIYIPLFFLFRYKIPMKWIWTIFILLSSFFLFHISFMELILNRLGNYTGGKVQELIMAYLSSEYSLNRYSFSIGFFERIASFILVACYYKKIKNNTQVIFCNFYICYFFFFMFFSNIEVLASRMSLLFIMAYWIVFPYIYKSVLSLRWKAVFIFLFIAVAFLKVFMGTNKIIYRYDNILFGIESLEERSKLVKRYHDFVRT